ncbi:GGDEF domain-containing protein [Marinobacter zhejiangensis]|uniref:diguanylate cyclase n=1 Tax=Marinobacter zhejiangensis TaxID=488535 RepID=A0A1I4TD84_9GAMM|nr:diguanylate cyclase [Marinobacter zhejiangensis]SFM74748.1 diguanylate cyclase (GGDEF) domain-containing protein [Marinobacter zhejiangensis]
MGQMAEIFLLSRFARISCTALVALALFTAYQGAGLAAAISLTAAALVWTSSPFHPGRARQPWLTINRTLLVLLAALLLASLWSPPWTIGHWLYAMPLIAFGLLPVGWGALLTLFCVVAIVVANQAAVGDPGRHQFISSMLLTLALSGILVYLREYKSRQLAPLRRTDELTQAASREYLSADLHKEIQRSEREGTDMAVILVGLDSHLSDKDPDEDIRAILPRIGRFLHSQLRDFDSYYRVADLQFLVILPNVATAEAAQTAETVRKGLGSLLESHGLNLTVSAGIAGLNIGDDSDSLQQSAANALRRAQQQGGNRVQSYSTWSEAQVTQARGPVQ